MRPRDERWSDRPTKKAGAGTYVATLVMAFLLGGGIGTLTVNYVIARAIGKFYILTGLAISPVNIALFFGSGCLFAYWASKFWFDDSRA